MTVPSVNNLLLEGWSYCPFEKMGQTAIEYWSRVENIFLASFSRLKQEMDEDNPECFTHFYVTLTSLAETEYRQVQQTVDDWSEISRKSFKLLKVGNLQTREAQEQRQKYLEKIGHHFKCLDEKYLALLALKTEWSAAQSASFFSIKHQFCFENSEEAHRVLSSKIKCLETVLKIFNFNKKIFEIIHLKRSDLLAELCKYCDYTLEKNAVLLMTQLEGEKLVERMVAQNKEQFKKIVRKLRIEENLKLCLAVAVSILFYLIFWKLNKNKV